MIPFRNLFARFAQLRPVNMQQPVAPQVMPGRMAQKPAMANRMPASSRMLTPKQKMRTPTMVEKMPTFDTQPTAPAPIAQTMPEANLVDPGMSVPNVNSSLPTPEMPGMPKPVFGESLQPYQLPARLATKFSPAVIRPQPITDNPYSMKAPTGTNAFFPMLQMQPMDDAKLLSRLFSMQ